jgi:1,4-alpha-glucan branching enzyme
LNGLYRDEAALHAQDFDWQGFEWIDCHDAQNSVLIYQRRAPDDGGHLVVALNFTPVPRDGYRIGMPASGTYEEVFNSDDTAYGGSGICNGDRPHRTEPVNWMNRPDSLVLTLPPLAAIILKPAAAPSATASAEG